MIDQFLLSRSSHPLKQVSKFCIPFVLQPHLPQVLHVSSNIQDFQIVRMSPFQGQRVFQFQQGPLLPRPRSHSKNSLQSFSGPSQIREGQFVIDHGFVVTNDCIVVVMATPQNIVNGFHAVPHRRASDFDPFANVVPVCFVRPIQQGPRRNILNRTKWQVITTTTTISSSSSEGRSILESRQQHQSFFDIGGIQGKAGQLREIDLVLFHVE